jgi:hypothetical protein
MVLRIQFTALSTAGLTRYSDGRLKYVRRGELGMVVVVKYLEGIHWTSAGIPLDLAQLKLERVVKELEHLWYVFNILDGTSLTAKSFEAARPRRLPRLCNQDRSFQRKQQIVRPSFICRCVTHLIFQAFLLPQWPQRQKRAEERRLKQTAATPEETRAVMKTPVTVIPRSLHKLLNFDVSPSKFEL